ncbi:hypothetical protein SDC9_93861 [bioreactor metagenome]|uniref:Uncharacterized protein n=1 Tax=bioreactor metagenome TaxID=1076179 RepID=A0A645A8G7_9ZZZZ
MTTIGLMMGADSIKVTAIPGATPFLTSRVMTGGVAHSQTGKKAPANRAVRNPSPNLVGKTLTSQPSGIKTCIADEIKTPISIKGKACIRIPVKIMLKEPTSKKSEMVTDRRI